MAEKNHSAATPCLAAAVMSPVPSTSKIGNSEARIQRNVAEKQRRDKLNGYISELANIVPMVSMSSKRLDKTSILRLSAAHLRICKSSLGGSKKQKRGFKWCPSFLSEDQIREILESVDGFLLVTTSSAKVLFTSRSVERYLGHQDIDMIGHSLLSFIHPDDLDAVKDETEKIFLAAKETDHGPQRCSFRCRMREKGQPRSEVVTYQYVHFVGNVNASEEGIDENAPKNVASYMLKAFVKVVDISPYNQLSLEEATADEYVTRHSLDGTIIFADHRLATITGHMPHEVVGLSAYAYINSEDTAVALFAHHLMFSNDKGTGMIVYRLRTRNDKFVYLKSVGCLQFDAATSQVDHFVCVNQHLSDSDGDLQLKYFVDRFIPHIKGSSTSTLFESVKALQTSSIKSLPATDRTSVPRNLKDNLSSSPKAEQNVTCSGVHKHKENGNQAPGKIKDLNLGSIKEENQHAVVESVSKNSLSNVPMHGSRKSLTSASGPPSDGQVVNSSGIQGSGAGGKLQMSGTNVSYAISAADAEYFSKTIHRSTTDDIDTIYVSSLDSTLSIYKNSTNSSIKVELSQQASDNSYQINVQQNGAVKRVESIKMNGLKERHSPGKTLNGFSDEGLSRSNDQFDSSQVEHDFEKDSDAKVLPGQQNFLHEQVVNHIETREVTDCNSPFSMEFMDGRGQIAANHSSLVRSEDHLSLTSKYPHTSGAVLRNSMWSIDDCEMKEGGSNSSMDVCESLSYGEANDEAKDGLTFQEDFSLLSSTLSQADSNSASGWNEVFTFSNYPSDSAKDSHSDFS